MVRPLNRMWRVARRPDGEPSDEDMSWHEEPAGEAGDGEAIVRISHVVVDPMLWSVGLPPPAPGDPMPGAALGVVIESRDPQLAVGTKVSGLFGWQTYARVPGAQVFVHDPARGLSDEDYLGAVSYIGATAYLGVREILRPTGGETVVVTAAAGVVGSLAGQIAKLDGARVVGIATTAEQCAWLTGELGFAAAIDRRAEDLGPALARTCPDGIDACLDGLGGGVLDACLARLAPHARLALFGTAFAARPVPGPVNFPAIAARRARVQGYSFLDFPLQLGGAFDALAAWIATRQLRYRLDLGDGLEHAAAAMRRTQADREPAVLRVAA
jgi:NADPH-dependent curcumin reductase